MLDLVREHIRYMHHSLATEKVYLYGVRFFIRWSGHSSASGQMRHPRDVDAKGIEALLTMLATECHVSASNHNQALSAILFLYREVLAVDLPWLNGINCPARQQHIPAVLTHAKVARTLTQMDGITAVLSQLLYGTGMRLIEVMHLRIKDVYFARKVILVGETKSGNSRVVMLPGALAPQLHRQLLSARSQWEADRHSQHGGVEMPQAIDAPLPSAPGIANSKGQVAQENCAMIYA